MSTVQSEINSTLTVGQETGTFPQMKERLILMRLGFGCGFFPVSIIGLLHPNPLYSHCGFIKDFSLHIQKNITASAIEEAYIQSSPHRWTVIQRSAFPQSKGLKLGIMSSATKKRTKKARLGVLPIRARETLCAAASIFLLEATRFAPPLISDTDHN